MKNFATLEGSLLADVRQLIDSARQRVAATVNAELTTLYWKIGQRVNAEFLQGQRAEYGRQVVVTLARQLTANYGRSFEHKNLRRMMQFAEVFSDEQIVVSLIRQLSWTHFIALIPLEDPLKRTYYAEICCAEKWTVKQLRDRIKSLLYERTAISKQPDEAIRRHLQALRDEQLLSPDLVFRDPYFLDFLGLAGSYSEKDIESAIVADLQRFITELGIDFAFLARQKRITIDDRDYYIDLLFYHRKLKCLVVIDLKLGDFEAGYKGQMELYLRYLEKYEQVEGENAPIGLILCAGKNTEHVELLQLDKSNIRIADYLTALPTKEALQVKLHQAVELAKERLLKRKSEI